MLHNLIQNYILITIPIFFCRRTIYIILIIDIYVQKQVCVFIRTSLPFILECLLYAFSSFFCSLSVFVSNKRRNICSRVLFQNILKRSSLPLNSTLKNNFFQQLKSTFKAVQNFHPVEYTNLNRRCFLTVSETLILAI